MALAGEIINAINTEKGTKAYDTTAQVVRIDGGTAWVHIAGGVDETPVSLTVNCNVGDTVQIRVSGGRAFIVGNHSAPPTDDATAVEAQNTAVYASETAEDAKETAETVGDIAESAEAKANEALQIAGDSTQYFWHTSTGADTGAHITEVPQDEFTDPTSPNYHKGGNLLARTNGLAVRDGMTELATFGASQAVIGQNANGKSRTEIGTEGMQIIQKSSGTDTQIANLGYGEGKDRNGNNKYAPYASLGVRKANSAVGNFSTAEGKGNVASGYCSHVEGGQGSQGNNKQSGEPICIASGRFSHAEGEATYTQGEASHAEGRGCSVINNAIGGHAEGWGTVAKGDSAHASGYCTIATYEQTVIGKFNEELGGYPVSVSDPAFIIGNGSSNDARSNAFTVSWNGNVEASGTITDGTGNVLSNKADNAGLFKIVDLSWTEPAINAHDHGTNTTHTVPSADRPNGMALVGIVGWSSGNYRIYPYVFSVNGDHSISVTMANATTANSASATVHAKLLYIKATSA